MVLDQLAIFSNAQAITASAASTNVYDQGQPGKTAYNKVQLKRRNVGDCVPLLIQVVEDFATLTSLTVAVQVSVDEAFTSPINVLSETIPVAKLKAGYISAIDKLPRGTNERYIRIYYTVTGTAPTAGKMTAGFVAAVDGAYTGNV